MRDGLSIDADISLIAAHQPDNHVKRRCLACAVGAKQAHHFTLLHCQGNILDHFAAAIGFGQMQHFEATGWCRLQRPIHGSSTHWTGLPKAGLERKPGVDAGAACGAGLCDGGSFGGSTARTRPLPTGLVPELVPCVFCPSTVKTSVRLL